MIPNIVPALFVLCVLIAFIYIVIADLQHSHRLALHRQSKIAPRSPLLPKPTSYGPLP